MGLLTADTRRDSIAAWAFVAVQAVLLLVLVAAPAGDAWFAPPWLLSVAAVLQWVGLLVLAVGLVSLGRSLTPLPSPAPHGVLQTRGMYRLMRHPIYSGILALALGMSVRSGSPVIALATLGLVVLFAAKARWEEVRLRARYPGYDAYAQRTPRFVPGWPFGADRRPASS